MHIVDEESVVHSRGRYRDSRWIAALGRLAAAEREGHKGEITTAKQEWERINAVIDEGQAKARAFRSGYSHVKMEDATHDFSPLDLRPLEFSIRRACSR